MQRISINLDLRADLLHRFEENFLPRYDLKPKALRLFRIPPRHSCKLPEFDISALTSLSLSGCIIFSPITTRQVVEFISQFTHLQNLHLEYRKLGDWVPQALTEVESRRQLPPVRLSLPMLRRMKLKVPLDDFLPWFTGAQLPSLAYVHLFTGGSPPRDRNATPQFLQPFIESTCAQTVEDLCVWFVWETLPNLDLSCCRALRAVKFMEWGSNNVVTDFPKLVEIVQTITPPIDVFASEWPDRPQLNNVQWFIGDEMHEQWCKEPERSKENLFFPLSDTYP